LGTISWMMSRDTFSAAAQATRSAICSISPLLVVGSRLSGARTGAGAGVGAGAAGASFSTISGLGIAGVVVSSMAMAPVPVSTMASTASS